MKSKYEESIELNLDDSSDEEDDYKDQPDLQKSIESFAQQNPNIKKDIVFTAFILEDEGRRILYGQEVRKKYYREKKLFLSHDEKLSGEVQNLQFKKILKASLEEAFSKCNPYKKLTQDIDGEELKIYILII